MIWRNHELQERVKRGRVLWHNTPSKQSTIWWLYDDEKSQILAFCKYGRGADFRILMPTGAWQITHPRGLEQFDIPIIERSLGLRAGTLAKLRVQHAERWMMKYSSPGTMRNQWNDLTFAEPRDWKAYFKKVRDEAPPYIHRELFRYLRARRHEAYLDKHRFDWEKVYPAGLVELVRRVFSAQSHDHDYMDNFRVAKVGNRQHLRRYRQAKDSGCCGSFDQVITTPYGQFHIGFNYGH